MEDNQSTPSIEVPDNWDDINTDGACLCRDVDCSWASPCSDGDGNSSDSACSSPDSACPSLDDARYWSGRSEENVCPSSDGEHDDDDDDYADRMHSLYQYNLDNIKTFGTNHKKEQLPTHLDNVMSFINSSQLTRSLKSLLDSNNFEHLYSVGNPIIMSEIVTIGIDIARQISSVSTPSIFQTFADLTYESFATAGSFTTYVYPDIRHLQYTINDKSQLLTSRGIAKIKFYGNLIFDFTLRRLEDPAINNTTPVTKTYNCSKNYDPIAKHSELCQERCYHCFRYEYEYQHEMIKFLRLIIRVLTGLRNVSDEGLIVISPDIHNPFHKLVPDEHNPSMFRFVSSRWSPYLHQECSTSDMTIIDTMVTLNRGSNENMVQALPWEILNEIFQNVTHTE